MLVGNCAIAADMRPEKLYWIIHLNYYIMTKTIEVTTGFLGEEYTFKVAITHFLKEQEQLKKQRNKDNKDFIPNQHIVIAHIKNCKSILKKL